MLYYFLIAAGIVCGCYYLGIGIYTGGFGGSSLIWLGASVILIVVTLLYKKGYRFPAFVEIAGGIVLAAGFALFLVVETLIVSEMGKMPEEGADYVIVLGAKIDGTRITSSLRYRLDAAYDYLSAHEEVKAVVSGGQGKGEAVSEAEAMKAYLVEKGIGESRILMENRSVNTRQNLSFSRELTGEDSSVIIVSNNFHIFRAKMLAKNLGYHKAQGLPAPSDPGLFVNYMVREAMAVVKDALIR